MQKTFSGEFKILDEAQGIVEAAISTFGVIDSDGDVTSKSSFPADGHPVIMSAYNHQSWKGALPYGYGSISTTDTEAQFKGQFLMDTSHGADAFRTVKALSEQGLQQWSYSLTDIKAHKGNIGTKMARFLDSFDVAEVSPVIKGASVDTRTLNIKGTKQLSSMVAELLTEAGKARWGGSGSYVYLDDWDPDTETAMFCVRNWDSGEMGLIQVDFTRTDTSVTLGDAETPVVSTSQYLPKGIKFAEHSDLVLVQVEAFIKRANEVVTLRAEKGKGISEDSKSQIVKLRDQLEELLATPTNHDPLDEELLKAFIRSQKQLQRS